MYLISQANVKTVPQGGYMPSPRKIRSAVPAASYLKMGSPRLTKWTIADMGSNCHTKVCYLFES